MSYSIILFLFFIVFFLFFFFFFNDTATTEIYTLSLHDALPIFLDHHRALDAGVGGDLPDRIQERAADRSEEHTSELQSRRDLVCRLLLEKKKKKIKETRTKKTYKIKVKSKCTNRT